MDNFYVTKFVTKLGYYVMGGGTILLCVIVAGVITKSIFGAIGGAFVGIGLAIPLLLACEFSYAIVKIAENTAPEKTPERHKMAS
jgi:hypothetical protein